MGKFLGVTVMACACLVATGCASAPISVAGSALPGSSAPEIDQQSALRRAVDRLQSVFEDRGWIRPANSMAASARGWMARLTGQADEEEPSIDRDDALPYLAMTDIDSLDSDAALELLRMDLEQADALVRDVDIAAHMLATTDQNISRSSLTRDLEHVERAVAHSRQALETFDAAIAVVAPRLDTQGLDHVHMQRARLASHAERLRDRADELASLRHNLRASAS
jgi:hypothetical protein